MGVQVVRHSGLLQSANTSMLQQKLALRTPYVTPLNILQVTPIHLQIRKKTLDWTGLVGVSS